jgi:hypothetical protein
MITLFSRVDGKPVLLHGVQEVIIHYVETYGHITSLDRWAHEQDIDARWARCCARNAAQKGLITMTRLRDKQGQPYQITLNAE